MKSDAFWKEILEQLFQEFMQFFYPEIHKDIDFSHGYQFMDKEFQQITKGSKSGRKIVDKLVKVYLKDGSEKWLLIHIEIQAQKEEDFAKRMFIYYYRIFDKFLKEVISLALLTDTEVGYRPDEFKMQRWNFSMIFKFPLVKIIDYIDYDFEKALQTNPFPLIVQAYLKTLETEGDNQKRFEWKRKFLIRLYDLGFSRETIAAIFKFTEWIMELPDELEKKLFLEIKSFEEDKSMSFMTYAEKQGMREGIHSVIEFLFNNKFGEIDDNLLSQIKQIDSEEILKKISLELDRSNTIEEFKKRLYEANLL